MLAPKVRGALVLDALLGDAPLDFFVALLLHQRHPGPGRPGRLRRRQRLPQRLRPQPRRRAGRESWPSTGASGRAWAWPPARPGAAPGRTCRRSTASPRTTRSWACASRATRRSEPVYRSHYRTDDLWLLDEHRIEDGERPSCPAPAIWRSPAPAVLAAGRAAGARSGAAARRLLPLPAGRAGRRDRGCARHRCGAGAPELTSPSPAVDRTAAAGRSTPGARSSRLGGAERARRRSTWRPSARRCAGGARVYEPETQHTRQEDFVRLRPALEEPPPGRLRQRRSPGHAGAAPRFRGRPGAVRRPPGPARPGPARRPAARAGLRDRRTTSTSPSPASGCASTPRSRASVVSHVRSGDRHRAGGLAVFDVTVADAGRARPG